MVDIGHVSTMLPVWSSTREDAVSKQSEGLSLPTCYVHIWALHYSEEVVWLEFHPVA